jgi:hypothetical protein
MNGTEPQRRQFRDARVDPDRITHLVVHNCTSKAKSLELAAIRLTWANKFLPDTTTLRIVVVGAVT